MVSLALYSFFALEDSCCTACYKKNPPNPCLVLSLGLRLVRVPSSWIPRGMRPKRHSFVVPPLKLCLGFVEKFY